MIEILNKSLFSTINDVLWVSFILLIVVSFVLWIILPFLLLGIRNELKKINETLKDYFSQNKH